MKLHGLLLTESLQDKSLLDKLTITKSEVWDVENATNEQPKQWHAVWFEDSIGNAQHLASTITKAMKPGPWYTNFSANNEVYVIFPNRVITYTKGDTMARQTATDYARSILIPESQLDWSED